MYYGIMNVYIDINGVMLTKNHKQAYFLKELLSFLIAKHSIFWLTTHCKGETDSTIAYLSQFLDTETLNLTKNIHPTDWKTFKSEAIDFTKKFIWLDDYLMESEMVMLRKNNTLNSWIPINLEQNPNQLKDIYQLLNT